MSITYSSYLTQLITLNSIASSTDTNFNNVLGGCIDYAEQRMYRELDLLVTRVTDTSATLSSGVRTFSLPTSKGTFLVVERVNFFSSAGTTSSNGTRTQLVPTSPDFIDIIYPSAISSNCGPPEFYAMQDNATIILGPCPDQAYTAEVTGTQRPTPLSSGNSSTWLTQNLPDAFMAASMVYMAAYQRDFGAQSEDPKVAQSWEQQYRTLMDSANLEELRKRFMGASWTPMKQTPQTTPPRA